MVARTYPQLFWSYIIENRKPHTQWEEPQAAVLTAETPAR
jgi:hypothetical protein